MGRSRINVANSSILVVPVRARVPSNRGAGGVECPRFDRWERGKSDHVSTNQRGDAFLRRSGPRDDHVGPRFGDGSRTCFMLAAPCGL